ncbi:hypothetical protein N2152v2_005396 [Parachlorella kessleri]
MEACLSALDALEAGFSSPSCDSQGATALWEAACRCLDALDKLQPAPGQEQFLRAVERVASLLGPAVSKLLHVDDSQSASSDSIREAGLPSLAPHTNATIAAAAAQAANGLVMVIRKWTSAADSLLLARIAEGAGAVLLISGKVVSVWDDARHLNAVLPLAVGLVQMACDPNASPEAAHHAAAEHSITTPGLVLGLLTSVVRSAEAAPDIQACIGWQAIRQAASYVAIALRCSENARLAEEFSKLAASGQLLEQLLRLVVLPYLADLLQHQPGIEGLHFWTVYVREALGMLGGDAIRPLARSILAEFTSLGLAAGAPACTVKGGPAHAGPGSEAAGTSAEQVVAAAAAPTAAALCSATLGGNLVLLGVKALSELRTTWKEMCKAEQGRQERQSSSDKQLQQRGEHSSAMVAAKALAGLALQLTRLLLLLPCTEALGKPPAFTPQGQHTWAHSRSSASYGGSRNWPASVDQENAATSEGAGRAAEPAFVRGVFAAAAALHKLVDSGTTELQLQALPGSLEEVASRAVSGLDICLHMFKNWSESTLQMPGTSWVPQDAVAALAAAEALMRLAPKVQQGHGELPPEEQPEPDRLLRIAGSWLRALEVQLRATDRMPAGQEGSSSNDEGVVRLTAIQAQAALRPAMHAAFTAAKLCHSAGKLSTSRRPLLAAEDGMGLQVYGTTLRTSISVVVHLRGVAYPTFDDMPSELLSYYESFKVAMLEATGSLQADAAPLLSGAADLACREPGPLLDVLSCLAGATVSYFRPGEPGVVLLAPKVVVAGLRLLLARRNFDSADLDIYQRFWGSNAWWLDHHPRLCAEVVTSGVLSDSALWLAAQLERGNHPPKATRTLVGSLHEVLHQAMRGMGRLQLEVGRAAMSNPNARPLPGGMAFLVQVRQAIEAALGADQAALATPGFWRDLAGPGGLAPLLKELAQALDVQLPSGDPARQVPEKLSRLALLDIRAQRACSHSACTNLSGASEGELGKGRHCARCNTATYCGVECQRAAWVQEHKLACAIRWQ